MFRRIREDKFELEDIENDLFQFYSLEIRLKGFEDLNYL